MVRSVSRSGPKVAVAAEAPARRRKPRRPCAKRFFDLIEPPGLLPNEDMGICRRPAERDGAAADQRIGVTAEDARTQGQTMGPADDEDRIPVIDDLIDDHVER